MKNNRASSLVALGTILLLINCSNQTSTSSTDITKLRRIVKIEIPIESAKWEIFDHPEIVSGMDNIESTILVAEIEPADPKWLEKKSIPILYKWLGPKDARPWMSPESRRILTNEFIDSNKYNCSYYETTSVTNRQPINGFACAAQKKILLYLVLQEAN